MYDPRTPNPSPEGSITDGIDKPCGLAIDKSGTLYVVGLGGTVTEYPVGQSSPSFTITSGLFYSYGIGIDSKGDVFVSNTGNNTVTAYKPGQTSPFETITGFENPVGVAVDTKDDVYVADELRSIVYIIPAGSSQMHDSGLEWLSDPIGIAFTNDDALYVANFGDKRVEVYRRGAKKPSWKMKQDLRQPTLNGFGEPGMFFQSDQTGAVFGYKVKNDKGSLFSTIRGIPRPIGIASWRSTKQ
jgi:DNA-binding beta-propeller fold protein YncE